MAQRVKLEVRYNDSNADQEAIFEFKLTNNGTSETINVEQYRVTVAYYIDSKTSAMDTTIQAGYDRSPSIPQGGVTLFTPDLYAYESNGHPTYIKTGERFNLHLTARFQAIQSLPSLPSGTYVAGAQLRLKRSDYKEYSLNEGNTGTKYVYEDSYSFTDMTTAYSVVPHITLEHNDIDPSNSTSSNWAVVQSWDGESTPNSVTSVLPYNALNGNTYFPTYTNHVWVDCKADTWIDSNKPTTNYGASDRIRLSNGVWDGTGVSKRRGLLFFDLASELPAGVTVNDITDSVVYLHTDSTTQAASKYMDLHYLTTSFNEAAELTANWNTYNTEYGNVAASWLNFANNYNQAERLSLFEIDLSTLPDPSITGLGVKYRDESGTETNVTYYSKEYGAADEDDEPRLIVRFEQPVVTDSNLKSYFVW